jgi:pantoate kinase
MRRLGSAQAVAFAPGHVTGLFVPDLSARDPRGRGSRGAGVVLELGARAYATLTPDKRAPVRVRDSEGRPLPITEEAIRHLGLPAHRSLTVRVEHELPVGQGFGMSAAGTLAATLAVARLLRHPAARAVQAAHLAELSGGGGLGGVAAILAGGLEVRARAGIPAWGAIRHAPFRPPILVVVVGRPLPSPRLLRQASFLERVERAGRGLERLGTRPSAAELLDASEAFTDELGLAPASVRATLRGLRRRGWWAAQAMFGRSVFAVPRRQRARAEGIRFLEARRVRGVEVRAWAVDRHPLAVPQPF